MSNSIRATLMISVSAASIWVQNPKLAEAQDLESFAVIAAQTITNTGPTTINGNIAVSPGNTFTGFGSVTHTGSLFLADAVAVRMQHDLATLYTYLAGLPISSGGNLTGQDLGGMTLSPGVYNYDSSALLSAGQTLTLDAKGNPDAVFIINIGSTLTVGSGAKVELINGAQGGNVFYRVGSSATLNTTAEFDGQIVALTSITMNTAAKIECGAAMARNGSVTLDTNTISICVLDSTGFDDIDDEPDDDGTPDEGEPGDGGGPDGGGPDGGGPDGGGPGGGGPDDGVPDNEDDTPLVLPGNANNVLESLAELEAGGTVLPAAFAIIPATQTPAQLAITLSQLSPEVATGVAPLGFQSMHGFLDRLSPTSRAPRLQLAAPRDEGVPIGMVPDRDVVYGGKYDTAPVAPELTYQTAIIPRTSNWAIWMSGYGTQGVTSGSQSAGTRDLTIDTAGLTFGFDYLPNSTSRYGVALGLDSGSFSLANDAGTGSSNGIYAALYGSQSFEKAYVGVALAYGQSDFTTEREVNIAGRDIFRGQETSTNLAAQIEAGYHFGNITPFVGLRAQRQEIPAYSETTVLGSSTYSVNYEAQTAESLRSELGVQVGLLANAKGSLDLRASWAHEFADVSVVNASFQAIPGTAFEVAGAVPDRNSAIISLRGEYGGPVGLYAGADLMAEYSNNSEDYGGSLTIGYRW